MRALAVGALAFVVTIACGGFARASDADVAAADVLFTDGRRAVDAGDWNTACAKFAQSYALDPAPGALLNLGDCEEHRDHLASAWRHFRRLADSLPDSDERKAIASKRAAELLGRAPRLTVAVPKPLPTMAVTRDGSAVSHASFGVAVPIDAGAHVIAVRVPGRKPTMYDVVVRDGETRELTIAAGDDATVGDAVLAPPPPTDTGSSGPSTRAIAGWVLVGAGGSGLVLGAVFGGLALSAASSSDAQCTGAVCQNIEAVHDHERAKAFALAADFTLAIGAALAATGIVLILTAAKQPRRLEVRATAGGMVLGGTF